MKINSVSYLNYSIKNVKPLKSKGSVCFGSSKNGFIKYLPGGQKVILKQTYEHPESLEYDYIGFLDKNDNLIKDIRFDKKYNEIRALEYQEPLGSFNFIKNSLTVSFDNAKNIRNVYLIKHSKDSVSHCVLNDRHGFSLNVYDENKNRIPMSNEETKEQIVFFLDYVNSFLKDAENVKLSGSDNILKRFSSFVENVL